MLLFSTSFPKAALVKSRTGVSATPVPDIASILNARSSYCRPSSRSFKTTSWAPIIRASRKHLSARSRRSSASSIIATTCCRSIETLLQGSSIATLDLKVILATVLWTASTSRRGTCPCRLDGSTCSPDVWVTLPNFHSKLELFHRAEQATGLRGLRLVGMPTTIVIRPPAPR